MSTVLELHAIVNAACQDRWRESFFSRKEPIHPIMHARGTICPSYGQFFLGDKPILFTDAASIRMYGLEEAMKEIPFISFSYVYPSIVVGSRSIKSVHRKLLLWKPDGEERAMKTYRHFKDGPIKSARFHRVMGILMCYPLDEVDAFCQAAVDEGTYADD